MSDKATGRTDHVQKVLKSKKPDTSSDLTVRELITFSTALMVKLEKLEPLKVLGDDHAALHGADTLIDSLLGIIRPNTDGFFGIAGFDLSRKRTKDHGFSQRTEYFSEHAYQGRSSYGTPDVAGMVTTLNELKECRSLFCSKLFEHAEKQHKGYVSSYSPGSPYGRYIGGRYGESTLKPEFEKVIGEAWDEAINELEANRASKRNI